MSSSLKGHKTSIVESSKSKAQTHERSRLKRIGPKTEVTTRKYATNANNPCENKYIEQADLKSRGRSDQEISKPLKSKTKNQAHTEKISQFAGKNEKEEIQDKLVSQCCFSENVNNQNIQDTDSETEHNVGISREKEKLNDEIVENKNVFNSDGRTNSCHIPPADPHGTLSTFHDDLDCDVHTTDVPTLNHMNETNIVNEEVGMKSIENSNKKNASSWKNKSNSINKTKNKLQLIPIRTMKENKTNTEKLSNNDNAQISKSKPNYLRSTISVSKKTVTPVNDTEHMCEQTVRSVTQGHSPSNTNQTNTSTLSAFQLSENIDSKCGAIQQFGLSDVQSSNADRTTNTKNAGALNTANTSNTGVSNQGKSVVLTKIDYQNDTSNKNTKSTKREPPKRSNSSSENHCNVKLQPALNAKVKPLSPNKNVKNHPVSNTRSAKASSTSQSGSSKDCSSENRLALKRVTVDCDPNSKQNIKAHKGIPTSKLPTSISTYVSTNISQSADLKMKNHDNKSTKLEHKKSRSNTPECSLSKLDCNCVTKMTEKLQQHKPSEDKVCTKSKTSTLACQKQANGKISRIGTLKVTSKTGVHTTSSRDTSSRSRSTTPGSVSTSSDSNQATTVKTVKSETRRGQYSNSTSGSPTSRSSSASSDRRKRNNQESKMSTKVVKTSERTSKAVGKESGQKSVNGRFSRSRSGTPSSTTSSKDVVQVKGKTVSENIMKITRSRSTTPSSTSATSDLSPSDKVSRSITRTSEKKKPTDRSKSNSREPVRVLKKPSNISLAASTRTSKMIERHTSTKSDSMAVKPSLLKNATYNKSGASAETVNQSSTIEIDPSRDVIQSCHSFISSENDAEKTEQTVSNNIEIKMSTRQTDIQIKKSTKVSINPVSSTKTLKTSLPVRNKHNENVKLSLQTGNRHKITSSKNQTKASKTLVSCNKLRPMTTISSENSNDSKTQEKINEEASSKRQFESSNLNKLKFKNGQLISRKAGHSLCKKPESGLNSKHSDNMDSCASMNLPEKSENFNIKTNAFITKEDENMTINSENESISQTENNPSDNIVCSSKQKQMESINHHHTHSNEPEICDNGNTLVAALNFSNIEDDLKTEGSRNCLSLVQTDSIRCDTHVHFSEVPCTRENGCIDLLGDLRTQCKTSDLSLTKEQHDVDEYLNTYDKLQGQLCDNFWCSCQIEGDLTHKLLTQNFNTDSNTGVKCEQCGNLKLSLSVIHQNEKLSKLLESDYKTALKDRHEIMGTENSQNSQDFKCQNDNKIQDAFLNIGTCNVNSSHHMSITDGSASKHAKFSDLADKQKCTGAVPNTGATKLQSSLKRPDKTRDFVSCCDLRNTDQGGCRVKNTSSERCYSNNFANIINMDTDNICDFPENLQNSVDKVSIENSRSENLQDSTLSNISLSNEEVLSDVRILSINDRISLGFAAETQLQKCREMNKDFSSTDCCRTECIIHNREGAIYSVFSNENGNITPKRESSIWPDDGNTRRDEDFKKCQEKCSGEVTMDNANMSPELKDTSNITHTGNYTKTKESDCANFQERSVQTLSNIKDHFQCDEKCSPVPDTQKQDAKLINTLHDNGFYASCKTESNVANENDLCRETPEKVKNLDSEKYTQLKTDMNYSKYEKVDINGFLQEGNLCLKQIQLGRFDPGGNVEHNEYRTSPYVLESQEKHGEYFQRENNSGALFSQQTSNENNLIMTQLPSSPETGNLSDQGNDMCIVPSNQNKSSPEEELQQNCIEKRFTNKSAEITINTVPTLKMCISRKYPLLAQDVTDYSQYGNFNGTKSDKAQAQKVSFNEFSCKMKLTDRPCLLHNHKHSDDDKILICQESLHCIGLSEDSIKSSGRYLDMMHSQTESKTVNSFENGSLKNVENKLCTGSKLCDGNKNEISSILNWSKSFENDGISGLSLASQDQEDTYFDGTMSRDHIHAPEAASEISSVTSVDSMDTETLKTYNRSLYQDVSEDKTIGLSTVKITTQKTSCNLLLSENSNEPQDFMSRYNQKKSSGHKKFYFCSNEHDTHINSLREETNSINLAVHRDVDINSKIKLKCENLETPSFCDKINFQHDDFVTEIAHIANQNKCSCSQKEVENHCNLKTSIESENNSTSETGRCLVSGNEHHSNKTGLKINVCEHDVKVYDTCDNRFCSSDSTEHWSDKDNREILGEEKQSSEGSIQTDIFKTDRGVQLLNQDEELNSTGRSGLQNELIISEISSNKFQGINNSTSNKDNRLDICDHICVTVDQSLQDDLQLKQTPAENCHGLLNKIKHLNDNTCFGLIGLKYGEGGDKFSYERVSHEQIIFTSTEDNSDETYIDASELINPPPKEADALVNIEDTLCKKQEIFSVNLDTSYGTSTSTDSFVDAVENLDDDYLTSTNSKRVFKVDNDECPSQSTTSFDDTSTGDSGSLDDFSGWEDFSENLGDIFGDMESKQFIRTEIESKSKLSLANASPHASANDNFYQKVNPVTHIEINKHQSKRYCDMNHDAEHQDRGLLNAETGNASFLENASDKSFGTETRNGQSIESKNNSHTENNASSVGNSVVKSSKMSSKVNSSVKSISTKFEKEAVGSKIETALMKRTERRRRRLQQTELLKISNSIQYAEISSYTRHVADNINAFAENSAGTCDKASIQSRSCENAEYSKHSLTLSDNKNGYNIPESGSQVLSQKNSTHIKMNELNLESQVIVEAPLKCSYENNKRQYIVGDSQNTRSEELKTRDNFELGLSEACVSSLESAENGNYLKDKQCSTSLDGQNTINAGSNHQVEGQCRIEDIDKNRNTNTKNLEVLCMHTKSVDLEDIEFIDADDNTTVVSNMESAYKTKSIAETSHAIDPLSSTDTFNFSNETSIEQTDNRMKAKDDDGLIAVINSDPVVDCKSRVNAENRLNHEQIKEHHILKATTLGLNVSASTLDTHCEGNNNSNEIDTTNAEISEESHISVKDALELERQKLANNEDKRSRKSQFVSRRCGRRATIETCSLAEISSADQQSNTETSKRTNVVKKSESFRMERPELLVKGRNQAIDDEDTEDTTEVNIKVSDICKSFLTKTRASAQRSRTESNSKSPAPHRKLMKWVNSHGKWMRIPVDETSENDNCSDSVYGKSPENELQPHVSATSDNQNKENYSKLQPLKKHPKEPPKVFAKPERPFKATTKEINTSTILQDRPDKQTNSTVCQPSTIVESANATRETTNKEKCTNIYPQQACVLINVNHAVNEADSNQRTEHGINNAALEDIRFVNEMKPLESKSNEFDSNSETDHNLDKTLTQEDFNSDNQLDSIRNNNQIESEFTNQLSCVSENPVFEVKADSYTGTEVRVIGTALDEFKCGDEKHKKREELLFGLLEHYNRRKPKKHSPATRSQISEGIERNSDSKYSDKPNSVKVNATKDDKLMQIKSIPKLKAVKIQEEVFEATYDNTTNNFNSHDSGDICKASSHVDPKLENVSSTNNIRETSLKLTMKKSKTFSNARTFEIENKEDLLSQEENKQLLCEKRMKAGLRLVLQSKCFPENGSSVGSPRRLDVEHPVSAPDEIPSSRNSGQARNHQRSPEKIPKQLQRNKLLSEIVEVEENKEDNSRSCDNRRQHQLRQQRQESQKSVKRGNKRRSLSLPTGTLAFGDARIVYKDGHFTIETMDSSNADLPSQSDYSSGTLHPDDQDDASYNMPETRRGEYSSVNNIPREVTNMHNKPFMRRQCAKTVLKSYDSSEDVFYNDSESAVIDGESKVLNMGQMSEEVFNESSSSRASDMSVDSYTSDRTDVSTDNESLTDSQKLSSSSLPEPVNDDIKRVIQRAKRTSSFRAAQAGGALRLSGIEEDKVHDSSRARSVSLDDSQNSDLKKSPKIQSVQNENPTFLKKVKAKRKTLNENLNISSFAKQSESAREFFIKKMTLKGLFKKNKSDSSVSSSIKLEDPVSPPLATFQDDDIASVETPPSSPYRARDLRRRHTSADILKTYPESGAETDSNCPTPTQERSYLRHSISTPSTPSHESNSLTNLSANSAPHFRDEDEMSITSASSIASSIHSPPLEQPHKPKTPKPVGASPRRHSSFGSQLSRAGSQSSQRYVTASVTSLESDQFDLQHEDSKSLQMCECNNAYYKSARYKTDGSLKGSSDSLTLCQFCKQLEYSSSKSESAFSSSPSHRQVLSSRDRLSEDSTRGRKDSAGRGHFDRLGIISQADVASSNSNDSGIQRDASLHSSSESIKGAAEGAVRLRRNKSLSPQPDRPKSDISVRWADVETTDNDGQSPVRLRRRDQAFRDKPRPKSDLEDNIHLFDELFEEVLEDFETDGSSFLSERMKAFGSEVDLQPYCSLRNLYEMRRRDLDRQKNRRMSTPHPIKSRLQRAPHKLQKQGAPLVRSSSMPECLDKIHKRRKLHHLLDFHLDSMSRHIEMEESLSDESELSFDQASLQERSISTQSSSSQLTAMEEDEDNLTYAEALWDHITMDPEELGFRAQDVIEVLDMDDKDWWFGVIDDREGWFPATFVRIRVNQDRLGDMFDLDATIQDTLTTSPKLRRISMMNKNQARSNVVNEIINAEREYVKHLKDVVEGYIQHARKRTEMFPEERISLIFGNIEKIYSFSQKFVCQLEMCIEDPPHHSEIGQCFLDNEKGFEIYSDYCNNHPSACEELDDLCRDSKYKHFFEACRLLQELVEIPLEGFLLTPVQKICKYPLQLAELLKYTPPDHADYYKVRDALAAMRKIATLINERKRKMESIEKIAVWQNSVVDWEGEDLLERSSELIFSGELNKINSAGWSQERFFFLFDHQLVYCKKELLKRHVFSYKGRIDLDHCDIIDLPDGKDLQYSVTVKYGWKLHERHKDKWYLVYAKSAAVKQSWLKALSSERQRVLEDQENDFCVSDHWKKTVLSKVRSHNNVKDKLSGGRSSQGQLMSHKEYRDFTYATIPRHRLSQKQDKKKGWFKFGGGKKSKR